MRDGGLIVAQEIDGTMVPASVAPLPLHRRVHDSVWRTREREGAHLHMGFDLASTMDRAGLEVVHVRAEALVQTPTAHFPVGPMLGFLLPRIVAQGVATEAEIDPTTIDQQLIAERREANATYIADMYFGAWARVGIRQRLSST